MHTRQNLTVSLMLAISMVGISYGASGVLSGDGLSESTAYLIEDLADFDVFTDPCNSATYWSSGVYTKLACDPNLTGRPYTTAVIAPDGNSFEGIFNGDGHIIRNLTIDTAGVGNDYLGLFGKIEGSSAEVKNLGIENINITGGSGSWYLGSLCGRNGKGTITNCYSAGSIVGGFGSRYLGGLCGCNSRGTITNCYATDSVTSGYDSDALGGLCGDNYEGTITNCYATGAVTGVCRLGGLCGDNSGTITNCYATGTVTGDGYLGGLCGRNGDWSNPGSTITNCYATGSVIGGDNSYNLGGLCGSNSGGITNCYATGAVTGENGSYYLGGLCGYSNGTITDSFWDVETSGMTTSYGGKGLITEQMKDPQIYAMNGWAENFAWMIDVDQDYPRLAWQQTPGATIPAAPDISGHFVGNGTEQEPFIIYTAEDLCLIAIASIYFDQHYVLADDIDMSGRIYEPIGYCRGTEFSGSFDGNHHKIQNLSITGSAYLGCFGAIGSMGSVQNLGLENITITGANYSLYFGGLCGWNDKGTINNCYSGGSVTGGSGSCFLGGLCGNNYEGTITDCYAGSSVTGGYYIGGLSGKNYCGTITNCYSGSSVTGVNYSGSLGGLCGFNCNGTVTNCYSGGSVTGGNNSLYLGGLCGSNGDWSHPDSTITNCYATGLVTGNSQLGGLCGENQCGTISNCYATGSVTGNNSLGGLCGSNGYSSTIINCFWDVETSEIGSEGDDNYGATGKTTEQMQTESTFTDANWDFTVVPLWHMPFQATGYPMLGWQKDIPGDFTGRYGVYMDDFAILSNAWLSDDTPSANWNEHCDLDNSGIIDPGDLKIFAEHWLCD